MQQTLLLSLGAILGANARYWVGIWAATQLGAGFPFGTFFVNISGCFLIGLFNALGETRFAISPQMRIFFAIGFLGTYTTFSSFSFETINLLRASNYGLGVINILSNMVIGLLAVILGLFVGRLIG